MVKHFINYNLFSFQQIRWKLLRLLVSLFQLKVKFQQMSHPYPCKKVVSAIVEDLLQAGDHLDILENSNLLRESILIS